MKACTFCGCQTNDKSTTCASCGSSQFVNVCPNCSNKFDGRFCPSCGVSYDATGTVCPRCGHKFYTKACPDCGYTGADIMDAPATPQLEIPRQYRSGAADPMALGAFLCSILGLMTCLTPLSIVAIVMAVKAKKNDKPEGRKMVSAAMVISILSLAMSVLYGLIYVIAFISGSIK